MQFPVLVMILTGFAALSLAIPGWAAAGLVLGATAGLYGIVHVRSKEIVPTPHTEPPTTVTPVAAPVVSRDPTFQGN